MKLVNTSIGRLRVIAFVEGISLLLLLFLAMPLKYMSGIVAPTSILGSVHGGLFLLFVFSTLHVGIEENWKFTITTWKVLLACIIPFGTFYIDRKILRPIYERL